MQLLTRLSFLSLFVLLPNVSSALTLGEMLNPYDTYFANCNYSDANLQKVCSVVQTKVNDQLRNANLAINNGDLVYSFNQGMNNVLINSCTRTTTLKGTTTNATLSQSANITLKGNAISKPAIFGVTLPIKVYFRDDFQDTFGASISYPSINPFDGMKSKCVGIGSDSYYGDVTASTTATITAMLSLEPRYAISASNHFVVQLKPVTDVSATVNNLQLNLDLHGVSPFANMLSLLVAPINAVNGQVEAISDGGNIKSIIASQNYAAIMSLASTTYGAVLTDYSVGNPLQIDSLVNSYLQNKASQILSGKAISLSNDMNSRLRAKLSQALNLDSEGKAIYAFDRQFNSVEVTQLDKDAIAALEIAAGPALSFRWSSAGPIAGMFCTLMNESADPHTWNDNYLCTSRDIGLRWNSAGVLAGMNCTQIYEPADPDTWNDNYLCLPPNSPIKLHWSSAGVIAGKSCIQINEPAEPASHTWWDNYLCWAKK